MQMYDYIKQRMKNMGYDPDDVVIEPIIVAVSSLAERQIIHEPNVYYYLYDCSDYTHSWTIESDVNHITNTEFIINQQVPYGIVELTGNIHIITLASGQSNTLMFYKATPGKLLQTH